MAGRAVPLDLLILKIVALGPGHGYAIAQRLQQVSKDVVQGLKERFTPLFIVWKTEAFSTPPGKKPSQAARPSFTG